MTPVAARIAPDASWVRPEHAETGPASINVGKTASGKVVLGSSERGSTTVNDICGGWECAS